MFFFKVEISSFDDAAKTLFVVPEQHSDEQGVPFEDKRNIPPKMWFSRLKSISVCLKTISTISSERMGRK